MWHDDVVLIDRRRFVSGIVGTVLAGAGCSGYERGSFTAATRTRKRVRLSQLKRGEQVDLHDAFERLKLIDRLPSYDRATIESYPKLKHLAHLGTRLKNLGWQVQTQIHLQCRHESAVFLPWHRTYLMYFERILGRLIQKSYFALPYWDWTRDKTLPAFMWRGSLSNHTRTIDQQYQWPTDDLGKDVDMIMPDQLASFMGLHLTAPGGPAKGKLESGPHDTVHTKVGGDLQDPETASRDPLFWTHHAFVDLIWARWQKKRTRRYPKSLLKTPLVFINEQGETAKDTVSNVIKLSQCGYTYDNLDGAELDEEYGVAPSTEHFPIASGTRSHDVRLGTVYRWDLEEPVTLGLLEERYGKQPGLLLVIAGIAAPRSPDARIIVKARLSDEQEPQVIAKIGFFSRLDREDPGRGAVAGHFRPDQLVNLSAIVVTIETEGRFADDDEAGFVAVREAYLLPELPDS